ncbi:uracil-DNA glycosylase family protein [Flavobacterium alkalisoli]|uniref:uracil-DNA glycosylase family protein n=1 Tax=Flavobacterium alkalisoli TaxID=2602769 RepID=UPI003A8CB85C
MDQLLNKIRQCSYCAPHLPFAPKPIIQAHPESKIIIIGQAPGLKVQNSGIPWDDQSGNELRRWLGVNKEQFYNPKLFALIPMGFCYPGKGKSGDLPPRQECAPLWHEKLMAGINKPQLRHYSFGI